MSFDWHGHVQLRIDVRIKLKLWPAVPKLLNVGLAFDGPVQSEPGHTGTTSQRVRPEETIGSLYLLASPLLSETLDTRHIEVQQHGGSAVRRAP